MLAGHRGIIHRVKPVVRSFQSTSHPFAAASGFSRFNPWAKKTAPAETAPTPVPETVNTTAATFDVSFEDNEASLYWLAQEPVQDPEAITSAVRAAVLEHVPEANESSWKTIALSNNEAKFKVVTESIKQVGKEMPNRELNNIQTAADVLAYFLDKDIGNSTPNSSVQQFFTENASSLPPNMTFNFK